MITREELIAERTRHEVAIGVIDDLLKRCEVPPTQLPISSKVAPARGSRRATLAPAETASPVGGKLMMLRRVTIGKILEKGPENYSELQKKTGIPNGSMHAILNCTWFTKSNESGKYELTQHGREAVANAGD